MKVHPVIDLSYHCYFDWAQDLTFVKEFFPFLKGKKKIRHKCNYTFQEIKLDLFWTKSTKQADMEFEMTELPVICSENPVYESIDQPASSDSFLLLENTNQTGNSGHSSDDHSNQPTEVNPGRANRVRGSKRVLFALVIFVGLISLLVLVLTILKFGSSNEGQFTG